MRYFTRASTYDKTYESLAFFIYNVVCVKQPQSRCGTTAKLVIISWGILLGVSNKDCELLKNKKPNCLSKFTKLVAILS